MEQEDTDETLMLRYRDGDARAFETLYARHKGPLFRYLLRQCGERVVAEELFQEVWMNLIRARARYTVQARFTTYLYHIAHHRFIDHCRQRAGARVYALLANDPPALDQLPAASASEPERQMLSQERVDRLREALDRLPPLQCEAFLLREEAGLSLEQIAEVTGVNAETAKSRLRYAVNRLRHALRERP